jgi:hypothetical protein
LSYSFRLANEPYEHFFCNIHFEDLMFQLTHYKFDILKELSLNDVLDKINNMGTENLTQEERVILQNHKL